MTLRFNLVLRPSPCEIRRYRDTVRELLPEAGSRETAERMAASRVFLVGEPA